LDLKIIIDASTLDLVTTIATIVIAIAAFVLSIWQFYASRTHNKLSVRPLLVFEAFYDPTSRGFGIFVMNKGTGPAIISDFRILVDGDDKTTSAPNPWAQALKNLDLNYKFIQHISLLPESAISPQERLPLITADKTQITDGIRLHMKQKLPRVGIEILYRSVYGGKPFKARYEGRPELLRDEEWIKA